MKVLVRVKAGWTGLLCLAALAGSTAAASAQSYELIAAAKDEGALTTMALADDWCGYGDIIDGFEAKYGIEVTDLNPNASSPDQIAAVQGDKDKATPEGPDVIDVTLAAGVQAMADGLTVPYKVATWDTIPDALKDPDGNWYGDYYGVIAFEVNSDAVKKKPEDWKDLLTADYAKSVALAGDPRSSVQASQGVVAAGLSASGGDLGKAAEAGLQYFADLNAAGNFVPAPGGVASLADKSTPLLVRWDYLALKDRDAVKGKVPIEVIVPKSGVLAGPFVQAISAYAAHPNAAKLWMEYLYSDEGQLAYLKGYCHPARYKSLVESDKVPPELKDSLPPAEAYDSAVFQSADQQREAATTVSGQWTATVGAEVSR